MAVTLGPADLHGEPDEASDALGIRRIHSPLQILELAGDWGYVYDPRGGGTAYVRANLLGPGEPPSPYVALDPPAVEEELTATGALVADAPLAFYPTPAEEAVADRLGAGTPIEVDASVSGEDGALWYRTADGYYLPHDVVSLPPPPAPPATPVVRAAPLARVTGTWIDVNLTTPARAASSVCGVDERTIRRWVKSGQLAADKRGGRFRISRDALELFGAPAADRGNGHERTERTERTADPHLSTLTRWSAWSTACSARTWSSPAVSAGSRPRSST